MRDLPAQTNGSPTALRQRRWRRAPRIRTINALAIVVAAILSLVALVAVDRVFEAEKALERSNEAYHACNSSARDLQEASDYLTSRVRVFVVTGNRKYMDDYLREIEETDRRGKAVETLRAYLGDNVREVDSLEDALNSSNELAVRELYAMKLVTTALRMDDVPTLVAQVELDAADAALSVAEQRSLAEQMVLGEKYQTYKQQISSSVDACSDSLLQRLNDDIVANSARMHARLNQMQAIIIALLVILVLVIFAVIFLILWPLAAYTREIAEDEPLVLSGAFELRYLADAYNAIYVENRERTRYLKNAAERDPLTGLYNRGAYDQLLAEHTTNMALLLVDVDYFKDVNDTYGHDTGDAVLKKVANLLEHSFRASDLTCRIGGDEFVVIMTDVTPMLRSVVAGKLDAVARALRDTSDGLPQVTLSIGVAFSASHPGEPDLYKAADRALYTVKEGGRNGYAFYDQVIQEVGHGLA